MESNKMTFEEYDKLVSVSAKAYNDAVILAKNDGYDVKSILCGGQSMIYEYTVSKRSRGNG